MDRLQLSEDDSDDLWNSPSKRGNNRHTPKVLKEESLSPEPTKVPHDGETLFDRQEAREAALRSELESVRKINQVIEGLLGSLDRAKGNMDTVSQTLDSASTLLNTWTRILSQTEHNQRLILNPNWQGAVQDVADSEHEELLRQQAAERRERELQQQREAAARKAAEDERKRAAAASARGTRGSSYGRVRSGLGRTPGLARRCLLATCHGLILPSTMNFAPYQDESPEVERAFSPSLGEAHRPRPSNIQSPRGSPAPALASPGLPSPSHFAGAGSINTSGHGNTGFGNDLEGGRLSLGAFDTSLPIRMDVEAMLAYLLLPPAGGVFLLLVEHKSDYVRFHAWQSSMLFTVMFIIHLLFSWSSFLSWLLLMGDLAMIGFLSMRAYRDVDTLEHFEVPIFGRLANSFVDDE
ncbi:uncharacterized protein BO97DRAFT_363263 [Aspergillus homomorphus CBS 101889]|uniref:DASH complex subunit DUO1 n=1 Tax=Aspergillus homomorphus (strain CBS 101889) TaxID=1450537 RepID=A0A395I923_ASPHC|nr:hypothetical protein BO97DRAFT_363263 [Aspergillus homomorphus CBS 101889]RAL15558.1 hypothetical protein BO97DRAFT_363263 [Aspergillus homomorphus CBS 101889]